MNAPLLPILEGLFYPWFLFVYPLIRLSGTASVSTSSPPSIPPPMVYGYVDTLCCYSRYSWFSSWENSWCCSCSAHLDENLTFEKNLTLDEY